MDAEKPTLTKVGSLDAAKASHVEHFEGEDVQQHQVRTKKLLRKVDVHLLPFLIVMYLLNFLDRSNLAQARQGTLEKDLGMVGTDFNLATSIFFVGYLLMQLPSNMLITRVRPSVYLCSAMTLWGVVSTCNAATHSFGGLIAVRFFLGFVEAPFFPGAIFLMSSWYTRSELTRRISWFYSGSALANMFGGLLGAAILGNLDGDFGLAGWRWLFIVVSTYATNLPVNTEQERLMNLLLPPIPGRSYYDWHRPHSHVLFAQLPGHDEMAQRRRETFRGVAAPGRHQRGRQTPRAVDHGRTQACAERLAAILIRLVPAHQSAEPDLSILLPCYCWDAWIWRYRYTVVDSSRLGT